MHCLRPLVGAIVLVINIYHPAQAQQELAVLRSSSVNLGAQQTFASPYQQLIKCTREATAAAGFSVELCERVSDGVYMILGRKTVGSYRYGEVIRVLAIRKTSSQSELRLLVRQPVFSKVDGNTCSEEIVEDVRSRLSSVSA